MFLGADEAGKGHTGEVGEVCSIRCFSLLLLNWISSFMFCEHHSRNSLMVLLFTSLRVGRWSTAKVC